MPFDGIDLERPTLRSLSFVLRNRRMWPAGFEWNYCVSKGCAIGLAEQLWGESGHDLIYTLPKDVSSTIFLGLGTRLGICMYNVRPEYVADAIDQWLTTMSVTRVCLRPKMRWYDRLFGRF